MDMETEIMRILSDMRDEYRRARRAPMYFPVPDVLARFRGDGDHFRAAIDKLCADGKITRHRGINIELIRIEHDH